LSKQYLNLDNIDDNWVATDTATLLFAVREDEVLLIRKKRGLGALREVREEVGVSILDSEARGELRFQFTDGYSIHVHVFVSTRFEGDPIETDEALPMWVKIADIPYAEMWADDRIWLPRVLDGASVNGKFIFSKDILLGHEVLFE